MDMKEIRDLAKAAAHSITVAKYNRTGAYIPEAVDTFLEAYECAVKKIVEKQRRSQSEVNMGFGSNEAKFR